jgi:selenocysteine-specific elongation factor
MHVVATAGHVDHGKSALVRALTGMEPDRWAEERRRGLTIDLGYAWTTLPSGAELAFVDVPGHQRFIGNMLAGVGPATAVLFVVAADEGWCAQSEEHLSAIHALRLDHGLLAVTRSDLADAAPVIADARGRIARSSLGAVEAVAVSAVTGAGVREVRDGLDRLVARLPEPNPAARVRLWVDRAFTIRGSGTVVTGTLGAGTVAVGDQFELRGQPVTVRAVQALGRPRDRVSATARVALNLRGVARTEIVRGDVLVESGAWHWTSTLDVRLDGGLDGGLDRPANLILHVGTAALPVRVRHLGANQARLMLPRPLPLRAGDRAILRDAGRQTLATGLLVLDADPPALARRGAAARRAAELAAATGRPDAPAEVQRRGAVRRQHLEALGVPLDELGDVRRVAGWLVAATTWQGWLGALPAALDEWRAGSPLDPGMPLEALRRRLGIPERELLKPLVHQAGLRIQDGRVARPEEGSSLTPIEPAVRAVRDRLEQAPFAAPERHDLETLGLGRRELAAAERAGRLLRISDDVILLPDAPAAAVQALRALPQPFTTSQARAALGTTRRVAIPLLEYLDEHGHTERVDQLTRRVRS